MFFDRFVDLPGAFEVAGEDNEVTRTEGDGGFAVRDGDFAFKDEAGFLFGVGPVEGRGLAVPYRPVFAGFRFLLGRLSYDDVFDGRHRLILVNITPHLCSGLCFIKQCLRMECIIRVKVFCDASRILLKV